MSSRRCLICSTGYISESRADRRGQGDSCSMLDRQLSALYLVSRLLEIPEEICTRFLAQYGNPSEWVGICGWCAELVEEGREIFDKITQLEREYARVRGQVRERMNFKVEVEEDEEVLDEGQCAAQEIRRYLDAIGNLEDAKELIEECPVFRAENNNVVFSASGRRDGSKIRQTKSKSRTSKPSRCKPKVNKPNAKRAAKAKIEPIDSSNAPAESDPSPLRKSSRQRTVKQQKDQMYNDDPLQLTPEELDDQMITEGLGKDDDSLDIDFHCELDGQYFSESDADSGDDIDESEVVENDKDEDFVPSSSTKGLKSKKTGKRKSELGGVVKLAERGRPQKEPKPKKKRNPKRETLTLEEVVEIRNKMVENLPPFKRINMPKEDLEIRKAGIKEAHLSKLCKQYHVKEFPCKTCNQVFTKYFDWYTHTTILSCGNSTLNKFGPVVVERIKCKECGKPVGNTLVLEDHMRTAHFPKEMFACGGSGCSKIYVNTTLYQNHYQAMLKSDPSSDCVKFAVKCPEKWNCRTAYRNNQEALDLHVKIRHLDPPPNTYRCLQCNKSFPNKRCLKLHILTHNKSADFKCDRPKCSSTFYTAKNLLDHIRNMHLSKEEGARYPCPTCGKEFSTKRNLRRHSHLHKPESPFLCTICGKAYKIANYLTIHMWTHDEKFYKSKYGMYKENAKRRQQQKAAEEGKEDGIETAEDEETEAVNASDPFRSDEGLGEVDQQSVSSSATVVQSFLNPLNS